MARKEIFDGENDQYYSVIIIEGLKITDFKPFHLLRELSGERFFQQVESEINAIQVLPFNTYKAGLENLTVKWALLKESPKRVAIVTAGELQPGRYKIFLEGIFNLTNRN